MKIARFKYQTELVFSSPASEHRFLLKILPQDDSRQRITDLAWSIGPVPADTLWRTVDGFGNAALAGHIDAPHSSFSFGIEGTAEVAAGPCAAQGEPPRALFYQTELTQAHDGLADLYNEISGTAPGGAENRILHFACAVHARLRYERGVTANSTTAQEAYDLGAGVCQDYAHVLLSLLRLDKTPCRYVTGLASDCGETHAWVEAWTGENCLAIDPTRDKLIDEGYVAFSKGRDFADCSIERGIFKGACRGKQTVSLSMEISSPPLTR